MCFAEESTERSTPKLTHSALLVVGLFLRFQGISIGGGAADETGLLESLQIPNEFYLPEAVAVAAPKRGTGSDKPVVGRQGAAAGREEEDEAEEDGDEDEDGGFLSFRGGGRGEMDVDT